MSDENARRLYEALRKEGLAGPRFTGWDDRRYADEDGWEHFYPGLKDAEKEKYRRVARRLFGKE